MSHSQNDLFKISGYPVRYLQSEDTVILQALLERSSDYALLATGLPPAPSAASSLMTSCPEGKTLSDKAVIGFFTEGQDLIGVLDVVQDYPSQADWWLGLLLFDPAHRSQGLGQRVYHAFEGWASQQGARCIYLGVIKENQSAYRFWRKMGFEPMERQSKQFGNKEHVVITMTHNLVLYI
jgi:ribosomal protein S18 acetylase RimI-like enzyme